jgi:hypothetical protein
MDHLESTAAVAELFPKQQKNLVSPLLPRSTFLNWHCTLEIYAPHSTNSLTGHYAAARLVSAPGNFRRHSMAKEAQKVAKADVCDPAIPGAYRGICLGEVFHKEPTAGLGLSHVVTRALIALVRTIPLCQRALQVVCRAPDWIRRPVVQVLDNHATNQVTHVRPRHKTAVPRAGWLPCITPPCRIHVFLAREQFNSKQRTSATTQAGEKRQAGDQPDTQRWAWLPLPYSGACLPARSRVA